jgi:hypothetical protein
MIYIGNIKKYYKLSDISVAKSKNIVVFTSTFVV